MLQLEFCEYGRCMANARFSEHTNSSKKWEQTEKLIIKENKLKLKLFIRQKRWQMIKV